MPCYHPLKAYRSREKTSTGSYGITFNPINALVEGHFIWMPCQRCVGCHMDRSEQWAIRCYHESQLYQQNCFVTLTYDDQHVPVSYGLELRELQLFFKRLRKKLGSHKIRFFASGEYGDQGLRPHYHALIFNYDFPDKKLKAIRRGNRVYESAILQSLWTNGTNNEIGNLTYQSAAYTARYCFKKVGGDKADDHYSRVSPIDGNVYRVPTEFCVMSRRPGLGTDWFHKFKSDVFPSDFLIVDGKKRRTPKFYLKLLQEDELQKIKRARKRQSLTSKQHNTKERLAVRETIALARSKLLKREL